MRFPPGSHREGGEVPHQDCGWDGMHACVLRAGACCPHWEGGWVPLRAFPVPCCCRIGMVAGLTIGMVAVAQMKRPRSVDRAGAPDGGRDGAREGGWFTVLACVLGHLVLPHLDGCWVCSASARVACFTARMVAVTHFSERQNGGRTDVA